MSLAAETRRAAEGHPFLVSALRAGVVNYTAAARFLDVGEEEAVATALRRYAGELPDYEQDSRDVRVRMESGIGPVEAGAEAMIVVGSSAFGAAGGGRTAILATGAVDAPALAATLERLSVEGITPGAAGVGGDAMVVVVGRREGANALRAVEDALEGVPGRT